MQLLQDTPLQLQEQFPQLPLQLQVQLPTQLHTLLLQPHCVLQAHYELQVQSESHAHCVLQVQ